MIIERFNRFLTNNKPIRSCKNASLPYLHLTSCPFLVISIRFLSFKDLFLLDFHLAMSRFLPFNNPSGLPTNNPWRAWYARDERCCLALALARQKEAFKRKQIMVQWKMGPCKISFLEIRGYFSTEPWTFWEKGVTLPKTNSKFAPENRQNPKRKQSYSNHPFSGVNLLLVSGRVHFHQIIQGSTKIWWKKL